MTNNKEWQRRSDEWVQTMHESRLRKENIQKWKTVTNSKKNKVTENIYPVWLDKAR